MRKKILKFLDDAAFALFFVGMSILAIASFMMMVYGLTCSY